MGNDLIIKSALTSACARAAVVGMARCAVRAAFSSGAMLCVAHAIRMVRSARPDADGDIAAETVSKRPIGEIFPLSSVRRRRGTGRGGAFLFRIRRFNSESPLSSVLSPFVPNGERKKTSSFETVSARCRCHFKYSVKTQPTVVAEF